MIWEKKGLICSSATLGLEWYKKNTMTPVPFLLDTGVLRVFLAFCDVDNVGRCGYVDLNPDNPSEILGYSHSPVLDVGKAGTFDEHGILPSCLIQEGDKLYLYYTAYQRQVSVPYTILSGLAVSTDYGRTFRRNSDIPVLERRDNELFQRSAMEVLKIGNKYKTWYTSNIGWMNIGDHVVPTYDIKYLESDTLDRWAGVPQVALGLRGDEYGLTAPQVFKTDGGYNMFYSIRSVSKGYRLGYAESKDGIVFERQDEKMAIDVSSEGFDSEMLCFGKIYRHKKRTYLFYCGNHYGRGGMGWAELCK